MNDAPTASASLSLYFSAKKLLPAKTRAFIEFVMPHFRKQKLAQRFSASVSSCRSGFIPDLQHISIGSTIFTLVRYPAQHPRRSACFTTQLQVH
jgi:hypothetical protein